MKSGLISAPISILFSQSSLNNNKFEYEFDTLSAADNDPIGQWLKLAKAKGDTQDTDKILLQLMVEMHRKIDNLERIMKNELPQKVLLDNEMMIKSIGFELFELQDSVLKTDQTYYGRLSMPVYPKRDVPIFFQAVSSKQAKIKRIHDRDQVEWNSYVTARERIMIRQMKALK